MADVDQLIKTYSESEDIDEAILAMWELLRRQGNLLTTALRERDEREKAARSILKDFKRVWPGSAGVFVAIRAKWPWLEEK